MKSSKPKVRLGIPASAIIKALAVLALIAVLIIVEVRYRNAVPGEAAAAQQEQAEQEAAAKLEAFSTAETAPEKLISEQTIILNGEPVESYTLPEDMSFGEPGDYFALPGICTFRGNNYRTGAAYGTANVADGKAEILWQQVTSALQAPDGNVWTGSGWTGQPLIAQWTKAQRQTMATMHDWARQQETLNEVIYATMDGYVYFLEIGRASCRERV